MTILGGNHQLISDAGDVGYPAWYRNLRDKSINQLLNVFPPPLSHLESLGEYEWWDIFLEV